MNLEIRQDQGFQKNEWRFNRLGWVLIASFVAAGLLGVLGPGPFSWATAEGADGIVRVDYQRVGHLEADDLATVTIDASAVTGDSLTVLLGSEWVQSLDIDGITPAPDSETATPQGLELELATVPGTEVTVQITYRAGAIGSVPGAITVGDAAPVSFNQLIIP